MERSTPAIYNRTSTVKDLMREFFPEGSWISRYPPPVFDWSYVTDKGGCPTTLDVDNALGPGYEITPEVRQRSIVDGLGLDLSAHDFDFGSEQVISNSEDVIRDFYQNFEPLFRLPLSETLLISSKPNGPTGFVGSTPSSCYQLTWKRRAEYSYERTAMIGIFTPPGSIAIEEWIGLKEPGRRTRSLLREMKRYLRYILTSHGRLKSC